MKYWIAGSRIIKDPEWIDEILTELIVWHNAEFRTGGAVGVDQGAEWVIDTRNMGKLHPPLLPDWKCYGKAAGFIRNAEGVIWSDVVVVFWDGKSGGSRNVINNALKQKKELHVFIYKYKPL